MATSSAVDDHTVRGMIADHARRARMSAPQVIAMAAVVILLIIAAIWWFNRDASPDAPAKGKQGATQAPARTIPPAQAPTASQPFPNAQFKPEQAKEPPAPEPPAVAPASPPAQETKEPPAAKPPAEEGKKEKDIRPSPAPAKPAGAARGSSASKDRFYAWIPPEAHASRPMRCYVDRPVDRMPERCSSLAVVAKRPGETIGAWIRRVSGT